MVVDPGLTDRLAGLTDAPLVDVTAQDPVAAPPAPRPASPTTRT
ncbi:hypothetical protein [Corynebacterium bovis]|nr:hypothetical protein [Corynebacterium bovis]